jgi:alkylhydroperoxidase family enzyme
VTREKVAALLDFENGPFDAREKAALRWSLKMTRESTRMTRADTERLLEHYTEDEVVEIAAVVGLFNYFNRFNNALGMEPTRPGEGVDT